MREYNAKDFFLFHCILLKTRNIDCKNHPILLKHQTFIPSISSPGSKGHKHRDHQKNSTQRSWQARGALLREHGGSGPARAPAKGLPSPVPNISHQHSARLHLISISQQGQHSQITLLKTTTSTDKGLRERRRRVTAGADFIRLRGSNSHAWRGPQSPHVICT